MAKKVRRRNDSSAEAKADVVLTPQDKQTLNSLENAGRFGRGYAPNAAGRHTSISLRVH